MIGLLHPGELQIAVREYTSPGSYNVPSQSGEACMISMSSYSVSGPVRGSHSLHLNFFPRKTMRGLERPQSMVATLVPFLCESSVLRLPLLEMEYRDRPAGSTTTALRMLAPCLEILSSIEGRSSERGAPTNVALKGVGGGFNLS